MASDTEVRSSTVTRLPPHLQGNLIFHRASKLGRPKRAFFVLLETVIYQYESRDFYCKGQRPKEDFKICLEEVCGITEILMSSKQYKNCSFKLTLNDKESTEYVFSAESRQAMGEWVNGLREAKEFWIRHRKRQKMKKRFINQGNFAVVSVPVYKEDESSADNIICGSSECHEPVHVSVTMWDARTHKVFLPCVFDMDKLVDALRMKSQAKWCAGCHICRLQQSSMEVWTVTANGIGHKFDIKGGTLDTSKLGDRFYLLVHNYKLLIIHFDDGTFHVIPCLVSIKAKEVPCIPVLADKLESLGIDNCGLFLINDDGTSNLFTPEEEPLKHSLQGRLILKTVTVSVPLRPRISEIQRRKLRKNQQNRREKEALKRVEKERCRHNNNFNVDVIKTDNYETSSPDGLVFYEHHYGMSNDVIRRFGSDDYLDILEDAETDRRSGPMKPGASIEARRMSQEAENDIDDDAEFPHAEETSMGSYVKCEDEVTVEVAGNISKKDSDSNSSSREEDGEICAYDNVSLNSSSLAMPECALTEQTEGHLSNLSSKGNRYASCQKNKSNKYAIIDSNREELILGGDKSCETQSQRIPQSTYDRMVTEPHSSDMDAIAELNSCSEPRNHERKPSLVDDVEAIAHLEIDDESQVIKTTTDKPTLIASTGSKFHRHLLCVTGSDQSSSSVPCESPYPTETVVKRTDIQAGFSGFSTLIDKEGENHCISCARNEHCDFTIISSPRVLELALKICSGHKINEEEVGEANKFSRICLSGWHLHCENGSWAVVERGALHLDNNALSFGAKVHLSDRLEAFFNKENKLWTLVENEQIQDELSSFTNGIQNEVVGDSLTAAIEDSPSDQDDIAEERVVTPILSQSNSLEFINVTSLDSKVNDDGTENLTSVERSRATVADGDVGKPRTESFSQEALHAATQRVFLHIVELGEEPEKALDNTKHENLVENVCSPLCSALWNMLSIGVRRKFFVKYTLWNIVEELKDVSGVIELAVNWVNNRCARLSDEQKFQAFVCECLNLGRDTLKLWLEEFIRQNKTGSDGKLGNKFYNEGGIVFQLSGNTLEELVLDLSRITCLPFQINLEKWIKTKEFSLQEIPFAIE